LWHLKQFVIAAVANARLPLWHLPQLCPRSMAAMDFADLVGDDIALEVRTSEDLLDPAAQHVLLETVEAATPP